MLLHKRTYYKPSKEARILAILDTLSQKSRISQHELGKHLDISGAMVNQYLKDLQADKLVSFKAINGKSFRYELTLKGERLRRELFAAFSSETIRIYSGLKQLFLKKILPLRDRGLTKLALFGASETCEVVLSALRDTEFEILTLLDNDVAKQGKLFHGYVISPPTVLESMHCQAVCITSFGGQDQIFDQLLPVSKRTGLEVVKL